MPRALSIVLGLLMMLTVLATAGWVLFRWARRSDDPPKLIFKWVLTLLFLGMLIGFMRGVGFEGYVGAFTIPFACVAFGVAMSVMWAPHLGALLAKPITSMFDGGDKELEPQPLYSMAIAQRKRGNFREAARQVRNQLARFPNDVTGNVLLAEIQAENLNDLAGAQVTIERFCQQPGHAPKNLAFALGQLADWHLKLGQDIESARQALEKVVSLLPGTVEAQQAAERIAHLGTTANLLASHDRPTIEMRPGVEYVGLLPDSAALKSAEPDPSRLAAELVKHLEQHPLDSEAREKLALIYADHYQRPDLATSELEQLIEQASQPPKQVVHWLNVLADLQIKRAGDYEAARQTLQRIIDRFSGLAAAENARQRLAHLKLELKGKEASQAVKLGSYAQDIGLKKR